jgi:hypothetical protein
MHVGDVVAMYVSDLGVLAEFVADLGQHSLLVGDVARDRDFFDRWSRM